MTPTETLAELKKLKPLPEGKFVAYMGNAQTEAPENMPLHAEFARLNIPPTMRVPLIVSTRPEDVTRVNNMLAAAGGPLVNIGTKLIGQDGTPSANLLPDSPAPQWDSAVGYWIRCCQMWRDRGIQPDMFCGEHPPKPLIEQWKTGVSPERDDLIRAGWTRMFNAVRSVFPEINIVVYGHPVASLFPQGLETGWRSASGYVTKPMSDYDDDSDHEDCKDLEWLIWHSNPEHRLAWWFNPAREDAYKWGRAIRQRCYPWLFVDIQTVIIWPALLSDEAHNTGMVELIRGWHGEGV